MMLTRLFLDKSGTLEPYPCVKSFKNTSEFSFLPHSILVRLSVDHMSNALSLMIELSEEEAVHHQLTEGDQTPRGDKV